MNSVPNHAIGTAASRVLVGILLLSGWACTSEQSFERVEDLREYLAGNDPAVRAMDSTDSYRITLRYLPPEYFALAELEGLEAHLSRISASADTQTQDFQAKVAFEKLRAYGDALYFRLTILPVRGNDLVFAPPANARIHGYQGWLEKLMFGLGEHFRLSTENHREVELLTYHMDRNFGMSPGRSFLLVFPKTQEAASLTEVREEFLRIHLDEFGLGTGPMDFRFDLPFPEYRVRSIRSLYADTPSKNAHHDAKPH